MEKPSESFATKPAGVAAPSPQGPATFLFVCPGCRGSYLVPTEDHGKKAPCQRCGMSVFPLALGRGEEPAPWSAPSAVRVWLALLVGVPLLALLVVSAPPPALWLPLTLVLLVAGLLYQAVRAHAEARKIREEQERRRAAEERARRASGGAGEEGGA